MTRPCSRPRCASFQYEAFGLCRIHYSRAYRLRLLRGELQRVEIDPVISHLGLLRGRGYSWAGIETAAHVAEETLLKIRRGEMATMHVTRARRILAVEPEWQRTAVPVPSVGTKRRLSALHWQGWGAKSIGAELGMSWHTIAKAEDTLYARHAAAIDDFYRAYAYTPGPDQRWAKCARRRGAIPAAAWDDETIDDPDAQPQLGELESRHGRRVDLDELARLRKFGESEHQIAKILRVGIHSIQEAERRSRKGAA